MKKMCAIIAKDWSFLSIIMYRGGDLYFATNFVEAFVIGAFARWGEGYQVSFLLKFWILVLALVQLSGWNLFAFISARSYLQIECLEVI